MSQRRPFAIARALAGALILLGLLWATAQARGRAEAVRNSWPPEADELYLPSAQVLRRMSLGHTQLLADLVALRTNVYFGTQISEKGRQKWLPVYLHTTLDLDPTFEAIYLRSAAILVYNGQEISLDSFLAADRILERGVKYFPNNWDMWFYFGFNRAFEMTKMVPKGSPRAIRWKKEGAEALRRATMLEGAPSHIATLAASMLTEQGERELAIRHLERTFAIASDPYARLQIAAKLRQLMGEQYRTTFEDEAARLEQLHANFPYAPESFGLIIGDRYQPTVDLQRLGNRHRDPAPLLAP